MRFLLTITVSLLLAFALQGCATQPKDVTYTAADLRMQEYFRGAKVMFHLKSRNVYEVTLVLGPLNDNKRSGQDAFYFIPAMAILTGCSIKRFGTALGFADGGAQIIESAPIDSADLSKGERAELRLLEASALPPIPAGHQIGDPMDDKVLRFQGPEFTLMMDRLCEQGMR